MSTKEALIKYIVDRWDPVSIVEREHIEASLRKFKTSTLTRMAADIRTRTSNEHHQGWLGWFSSFFKQKEAGA